MNINIRGENLEVTGALREYVEKKLNRLERYLDIPPASDAHVTLRVQRDKQNVEVTIPLRGAVLRAEEKNEDMYASIDLVVDKLEGQIRKHKTKANRKFNKGGIRDLFIDNSETNTAAYSEAEDELEVVRTKNFIMKPMDVEEAILQMNLIGHTFFVFANMDNNQINVVYKRDDGRYGLIETA
ncbi:MAG: ribosome-associated translation inhibitor RaiA [Paenibacillaceae bacterium]